MDGECEEIKKIIIDAISSFLRQARSLEEVVEYIHTIKNELNGLSKQFITIEDVRNVIAKANEKMRERILARNSVAG